MKLPFFILFLMALNSCDQKRNPPPPANPTTAEVIQDTILMQEKYELKASYEIELYSNAYSYYWVKGKDTLDMVVNAREYKKDSSLHLTIYHKKPVLFKTLLYNLDKCIALIRNNFAITKLSSLNLRSPVYYIDLAKELSAEYEEKFGRKNIRYERLDPFLMSSSFNNQLDSFFLPYNKKVKRFLIEKFQIINKASFIYYLPDTDLKDYPEFSISGMGVTVQLESKQ